MDLLRVRDGFRMIYTSYYSGKKRGADVSISLYPPKGWKGQHLPIFAPAVEILNQWKASKQDMSAEDEYAIAFSKQLDDNWQLIDLWLKKQSVSKDVTLLCYEGLNKFCHRHLVGDRIKKLRPDLWGGEVGEMIEVKSSTEHLSWAELMGGTSFDGLPKGWKTVSSLGSELVGKDVMFYVPSSRTWVKAHVADYMEQGRFCEIKGKHRYYIACSPDSIAINK
jgi:hypothetical protein